MLVGASPSFLYPDAGGHTKSGCDSGEYRDDYVQDFLNLTESDWMGNERYIAECMINIENRLNDKNMSLDDPNLIEDSVKEFVKMEWYVDFSKM